MKAGHEMDVLIAEKVMGWHKFIDHSYSENNVMWYAVENGYASYQDAVDTFGSCVGWSPSTELDDAWRVAEKVLAMDIGIDVSRMPNSKLWHAALYRMDDGEYMAKADDMVEAETAPLAICLAALRAVSS